MTITPGEHGLRIAKAIETMPSELRERTNQANRELAAKQHKEFQEKFAKGECFHCGRSLTSFDAGEPCPHWLLKPAGFAKKHLELLAERHSWEILDNFLRWVANEEVFAQNINDLVDEGTGKILEVTIKYKNLQWSFSCAGNDLSGHDGGGEQSKRPHYHLQMFVDDKPFIRYNDFHLPLHSMDIGFLEAKRSNPKLIKRISGGAGMAEILHEGSVEHIVNHVRSDEGRDQSTAPFKIDTLVFAEPGTTMKGEDIHRMMEEAKAQGVTFAKKARDLKNVRVTTVVSPGPRVIEQKVRSGRGRGKKPVRDQDRAWREQQKRKDD
jgi:hypothetical protein